MNKNPPVTSDRLYPWERMDGEGTKAFEAFNQYKGMPAKNRSVYQAWFNFIGKQYPERYSKNVEKRYPPMSWQGWSSKFQWVSRAASWDAYLQTIRDDVELQMERDEYRKFRKSMRQTAIAIIQVGLRVNQALVRRLSEDGSQLPKLEDITIVDKASSAHFKNASSLRIAQDLWSGAMGTDKLIQFLEQEGLMDDGDSETE